MTTKNFKKLTLAFMLMWIAFGAFLVSCQKENREMNVEPIDEEVLANPQDLPFDAGDIAKVLSNLRAEAAACQCLIYLRNCTGLPSNPKCKTGKEKECGAAEYGTVLSANKYSARATPAISDIVLLGTGFGGGISTTMGHGGKIIAAELIGKGTSAYWRIKIRSANWTNTNTFEECNCSNVENSSWININTTARKSNISFWRK